MTVSPLHRRRPHDHWDEMQAGELDAHFTRDLADLDLLAIFLSEVEAGEQPIMIVFGMDLGGGRHPLAAWLGTASHTEHVVAALTGLVDRGLDPGLPRLVVLNRASGSRSAVRKVFGRGTSIQLSRQHKRREILERVPEPERATLAEKLDRCWSEPDVDRALNGMRAIARELREADLGGSRSILKGLGETFTVARLGLSPSAVNAFSTTADLEWAVLAAASRYGAVAGPDDALQRVRAALIEVHRRSPPVNDPLDLQLLAKALRPGLELASPDAGSWEGSLAADHPAGSTNGVYLEGIADLAALLCTSALLLTVALGFDGVFRELLALGFVTLVPGWAVVSQVSLGAWYRR
jgi:hypothetical protein